jgi:hypothetical protein
MSKVLIDVSILNSTAHLYRQQPNQILKLFDGRCGDSPFPGDWWNSSPLL